MDLRLYIRFFGVLFQVLVWLLALCCYLLLPLGQWRMPVGAYFVCMLLLDQVLRARRSNRKESP